MTQLAITCLNKDKTKRLSLQCSVDETIMQRLAFDQLRKIVMPYAIDEVEADWLAKDGFPFKQLAEAYGFTDVTVEVIDVTT